MKRDRAKKFLCEEGHYSQYPEREKNPVKTSGKKGGVRQVVATIHLCPECNKRATPVAYFQGG
jgi:hypothetical protein